MLAFNTYIESGFQKHLKTCIGQLDLMAAFDTVWRAAMILKFIKVIPCLRLATIISNMLSNRRFKVFLGDSSSKWRCLNSSLAQGFVLSQTLFNIYQSDMPTI